MYPTTLGAPPPPATEVVVSEYLKKQTSFKWHGSFERLNRYQPGITGLLEFSRVRRATTMSPRAYTYVTPGVDTARGRAAATKYQ